jgi:ring-1,2-phenylacetyl-CoA epoxidase subunit PaaE
MAQFHPLKVKSISRQTKKAVSVSFEVPTVLEPEFAFKAGQYITLKAVINKTEVRRDYSLSSSPKSGNLTVTIKEIEGGLFSTYVNQQLEVGAVLEVGVPNGRFVYELNTSGQKTVVAFAAGSGITPIMSIIRTVLENDSQGKFILVYGNKRPEETIFYDTILELQARYSERFKVQFVYSEVDKEGALFGRIDKGIINYIFKNISRLEASQLFYLCGPEGMIQTARAVLSENAVTEERIFFELFTASEAAPSTTSTPNDGASQITVLVDDEQTTFKMLQKQTILEAALANDIDAPYSCQGGVCSSCICRVTKGTASMRQNNILTDNEIAEGLVLSCQAEPTSSTIEVDFDDI